MFLRFVRGANDDYFGLLCLSASQSSVIAAVSIVAIGLATFLPAMVNAFLGVESSTSASVGPTKSSGQSRTPLLDYDSRQMSHLYWAASTDLPICNSHPLDLALCCEVRFGRGEVVIS
ncbi:MAG TPA: hypothetical protein PLR25_12275 [Planctomycetaceae bacterium]|nr:hypothetical protein [Planctomycetaceae bacterium]